MNNLEVTCRSLSGRVGPNEIQRARTMGSQIRTLITVTVLLYRLKPLPLVNLQRLALPVAVWACLMMWRKRLLRRRQNVKPAPKTTNSQIRNQSKVIV